MTNYRHYETCEDVPEQYPQEAREAVEAVEGTSRRLLEVLALRGNASAASKLFPEED